MALVAQRYAVNANPIFEWLKDPHFFRHEMRRPNFSLLRRGRCPITPSLLYVSIIKEFDFHFALTFIVE
ncbi:hypothetical protein SAMN04488037_12130 [Shimia marina]|uniref:Uncharacterized protein n=1 Tax=Shimia marina TaxID=321267 RepID=A0A0P1EP02_9RHOB|nr:hypothetical protein SHM7688_01441 [Shimia marina]SFE78743.1 hypothetical protein SAMN04488037_12130 [Shimia marina]